MSDTIFGVPNDGWPEPPFGWGLDLGSATSLFEDALWIRNWGGDSDAELLEYFDIGGEA